MNDGGKPICGVPAKKYPGKQADTVPALQHTAGEGDTDTV